MIIESLLDNREARDQTSTSSNPLSRVRIVQLSSWPRLVDLRINGIPLLDSYNDEEKLHLVVGRLENLMLLNGSPITEEQRETSERFFIRYYEVREMGKKARFGV